jgi:predicted nucleotidyltransferase
MLAVEYCKALYQLNSTIMPITIKRHGQAYLDQNAPSSAFASATAIRTSLHNQNLDVLVSQTPLNVREAMVQAYSGNKLLFPDDLSNLLHYKLLSLSKEALTDYQEVTPDFANKIIKYLPAYETFTQFSNLLWTKDTTYARVCRNLMNILLDIKKDTWDVHQPVPYARVLGFRKESAPLLAEIKKNASIPLISKLADAEKLLSAKAHSLLELDMKAAHIYDSVVQLKSGQKSKPEMQKQIVIL